MAHMTSITTPRGTKLPLLELRGKDYLPVAQRLVWFREEHPDWSIETEPLVIEPDRAIFLARVKDEQGRVIATGTKHETRQGRFDFIEAAENGAIGRALALCGFGTEFAPKLDEDEPVAEAPAIQPTLNLHVGPSKPSAPVAEATPADAPDDGGFKSYDFLSYGPAATSRQVQYVAELAVRKLGAQAGEKADLLARLRDKFGADLPSAAGLSRARARMMIDTLVGMPDVPRGGSLGAEQDLLLDFGETA